MRCIKAAKCQHTQAVEVCPGVWAVPDDSAVVGIAATASDLPERTDLGGVLNRKRLVRVVPSGWPDCTIVDGRLIPVDAKTGEPTAEPAQPRWG